MPAHLRRIPQIVSITMTILAQPFVAAVPFAAEPMSNRLQRRAETVHPHGPRRHRESVTAPGNTKWLPYPPNGSGSSQPLNHQSIVDIRPLGQSDPVMVEAYRLVSRLGTGGMADVYYAFAPSGRPVVVKVLRGGNRAVQTCWREHQLASAVDQHCTAPVLGHGMSAVGPYLVMAHLPGYRCTSTPPDRPTSAVQLWALGLGLARTLIAVHARGIVHCDVKPSNLLVRGRDVRLIDFGIARYFGEPDVADGMVQCTRGWAAPEQLRSAPATPAVDIFAWGCVLAYLATGVHPFASQSDEEWILRIQSAEPDVYGVPAALQEVIRWTLARDPADRPTADDLATICCARR
jgi:serine/threonine protein kinase